MSISIVVPVFNGGIAFQRCLESLLAAVPPPYEIIVVDDGSTDQSCDIAHSDRIRVLRTGRQQGPAVARNIGAKFATSDWIFFVDADVTIPQNALSVVSSSILRNPKVDAFVGSYDDSPAAQNLLSQYKNLLHHYTHQRSSPEGFTFWGACGVIRRTIFLELGGFDERYVKPSIEDIELGYRLKGANARILVCPELQVKHWKRWDAVSLFRTDVFQRAIPWSELLLKHGRIDNGLNISRWGRARVALSGLVVLCAPIAFIWPLATACLICLVFSLLVLDLPVLNWFRLRRGLWFVVRVFSWHWFSHFYSGVAFTTVLIRNSLTRTEEQSSFLDTMSISGSLSGICDESVLEAAE